MLTVREAFEKAGYPVPGERVVFRTWTAVWETYNSMTDVSGTGAEERSCWQCYGSKEHDSLIAEYVFRESGWQRDRYCREIPHRSMTVDLSNLPAIDAYDALPDVVKKVVKP